MWQGEIHGGFEWYVNDLPFGDGEIHGVFEWYINDLPFADGGC